MAAACVSARDHTGRHWTIVNVAVLRQAGYPLSTLRPLVRPEAALAASDLLRKQSRARVTGEELRTVLRRREVADRCALGSLVGMLRPLPPDIIQRLCAELPVSDSATVRAFDEITRTN